MAVLHELPLTTQILDPVTPDRARLQISDLIVTDVKAAAEHRGVLDRVRQHARVYLPLVLLLPPGEAREPWYQKGFDELLTLPINPVEIKNRIRLLMAVRQRAVDQYASLIANSTVGIYRTTPAGQILLANPALARLLGYESVEALRADNMQTITHRSGYPRRRFLQQFETSDELLDFETELQRPDGSTVYIRENARAVRDADGQIQFFDGTLEDLTDLRQTEQALKQSEELHRALVENAFESISLIDPQGTLLYASASHPRVFGWNSQMVIGKQIWEITHPDDLQDLQQTWHDLLSQPGAQTSLQLRMLHQRMEWIWIECTLTNLLDNPSVGAVVANAREITQSKERQQLLHLQARLLESVGQAVIATDLQGKILYWNHTAEKIYGWQAAEVLGQANPTVPPDSHSIEEAQAIMDQLRQGESWQGTFTVQDKAGQRFPARITLTPFSDDNGQPAGMIGVSENIRQEQAARQKLAESEQFATGTLNALSAHICVLDRAGTIIATNQSWEAFARQNPPVPENAGVGANYLAVCDAVEGPEAETARQVATAIRGAIAGETELETIEYPCHSPLERRWFNCRITRFEDDRHVVVAHENITERRLAEKQTERHARRLRELADAAIVINLSSDVRTALEHVSLLARQIIGTHLSIISLVQDGDWSTARHTLSYSDRYRAADFSKRLHPELNLYRLVTETLQPVRLTQAQLEKMPEYHDIQQQTEGHPALHGWLAAPLVSKRGANIGIIQLSAKQEGGEFTENDELALVQLAQITSAAIENIHLIEEAHRRLAIMEAVNRISARLREVDSLSAMLADVLGLILPPLGTENGLLYLKDARDPSFRPLFPSGVFENAGPPSRNLSEPWIVVEDFDYGLEFVADLATDRRLPGEIRSQFPGAAPGAVWRVQTHTEVEILLLIALSDGHSLTDQQIQFLHTVSDISSNTIQRLQLLERLQSRAEYLLTINQLGRNLAMAENEEALYTVLRQAVFEIFPDTEALLLSEYDEQRGLLFAKYIYHAGLEEDVSKLPPALLEPAGQGTQSEVVHSRTTVIINDYQQRLEEESNAQQGTDEETIQSALYAPMIAKGKVFGVINIQSRERGRYDQEDARLLVWIANTTAVSLTNTRLYQETLRRMRQQEALRTIDMAITSSLDLRVTLNVILDQITAQLEVDAATVLLFDPANQSLSYAAGRGFRTRGIESKRLRLGEGIAGQIALERKIITARTQDELHQHWIGPAFFVEENFSAYVGVPLVAKGQISGVLELYHHTLLERGEQWLAFLEMLAGQAAIAIDNAFLFEDLQRSHMELAVAYDHTIEGWARALDLRDRETEGHTRRVTTMAVQLAREVGLSEPQIAHARRGALLHDIGKMGVPDRILHKPGPLSEEEWEEMRRHPGYAYDMLRPIEFLRPALDIPYCHHEKWDGSGYPRGLFGANIPIAARIFAVVDVWDALTHDRPYRKAWSAGEARSYLEEQSGKQFDPDCLQAFLRLLDQGQIDFD